MADELRVFSKMKVADLKKELKSRGFSTVGNKTELLERLQVAFVGADNPVITESDSAVADSEEILDEDEVLAEDDEDDEEEEETLGDELSPSPELKRKLEVETEEKNKPTAVTTKKIVLNRTNSVSTTNTISEKENQEQHQDEPVTKKTEEHTNGASSKKIIKLSSISVKERLEMRAQKFGVELSADAKKTARAARFGLSKPINTSNTTAASSDLLRKRAERFGLASSAVSNKNLNKAEMLEKLEKRKQRFNSADSAGSGKKVSTVGASLLEDEKKKLRAERFKISK